MNTTRGINKWHLLLALGFLLSLENIFVSAQQKTPAASDLGNGQRSKVLVDENWLFQKGGV